MNEIDDSIISDYSGQKIIQYFIIGITIFFLSFIYLIMLCETLAKPVGQPKSEIHKTFIMFLL